MRSINRFLLEHNLRISHNPCISPDFCLDWEALQTQIRTNSGMKEWPHSGFETAHGSWTVIEDKATGDCAWRLRARDAQRAADVLADGIEIGQAIASFPASWDNLLRLKNFVQEHDAGSTMFPSANANLGASTSSRRRSVFRRTHHTQTMMRFGRSSKHSGPCAASSSRALGSTPARASRPTIIA